jgi:hypothetical protein
MNLRSAVPAFALFLAPWLAATAQPRAILPVVLTLPAGPRTLALGDVGVTSRDDEVIFFNPAQLVVATGFSTSGERYQAGSSGGALSAVTRFNGGGVAIGMRTNSIDGLGVLGSTLGGSAAQNGFTQTSLEASAGIAQVVKGIRVGGAVKYAEQDLGFSRVQRGLLDLGVAKQVFGSYTVGAAVQNLGQDADLPGPIEAELPRQATLGISRGGPVGEFDLFGTAAVSWVRSNTLVPAGGLEVNYSWLSGYNIALRAGARRPLFGEEAFTAGAGFTMDRLSIDYALETLSGGRVGNRLGLRIR